MTHAKLVERAVRWLRGTQRCGLVLSEFVAGAAREVPDAIGWKYGGRWSVLVECKTSVSDFYAEAMKPSRRSEDLYGGIGRERYYMVEKGVLSADRVRKNRPGWGLLEVGGKRVRVTLKAIPFDHRCLTREVPLLYSYLRRHQIRIKEQPDALCAVELETSKKLRRTQESLLRVIGGYRRRRNERRAVHGCQSRICCGQESLKAQWRRCQRSLQGARAREERNR